MNPLLEEAVGRPVSRETMERLELYVESLRSEAKVQNLISASTLDRIWERHIADSAQLVALAPESASWIDIGSGAGLPGLVVAILTDCPVTLVEPRALRADFLRRSAATLGLDRVTVVAAKAQSASGSYDIITARAVASAPALLAMTTHLTHRRTRYLLMKGRSAKKELDDVRAAWQGDFRLVASRTDAEASIIVAERVRRRGGKA